MCSSSLYGSTYPPVTSSLVDPKIPPSTLFLNFDFETSLLSHQVTSTCTTSVTLNTGINQFTAPCFGSNYEPPSGLLPTAVIYF